jgi:hypothetical protein
MPAADRSTTGRDGVDPQGGSHHAGGADFLFVSVRKGSINPGDIGAGAAHVEGDDFREPSGSGN